jgi:hypothetical protein
MGGIHPRSKKPVGERLARGAFNTVYGGTGSITGPTLASCAVAGSALTIEFDTSLLRGDTVVLQPAFPSVPTRYVTYGGTLLWALPNATTYCLEPQCVVNATTGRCATEPKLSPTTEPWLRLSTWTESQHTATLLSSPSISFLLLLFLICVRSVESKEM